MVSKGKNLNDKQGVSDSQKHPIQPLYEDEDGVTRFKENAIVRYLLDAGPFDLNQLAEIPFSQNDREQFFQLIGYSLDGFGGIGHVSEEAYEAAARQNVGEAE